MSSIRDPKEGDITCVRTDRGYVVKKLLKIENVPVAEGQAPFVIHHQLICEPTPEIPALDALGDLNVQIWHIPGSPESEEAPEEERAQLLGNQPVTDMDFQGYYYYLQEARPDILEAAREAYGRAYRLADERRFDDSIGAYSEAISLMPLFHEALDNRGSLYFALGEVELAKKDFLRSIEVMDSDENALPHMKLMECYFDLDDHASARQKMEECLDRWPDHPRWKRNG